MSCHHFEHLPSLASPRASYEKGCEECLKLGSRWVHLRECLVCGNVACCDSSIHKHATQHFHATGHPILRSVEPGETWAWCYVDRVTAQFA
jgi:uncharacterized UBP type Zn finger protein